MSIFWGLEQFSVPAGGTAVTIGTFDGIHRGHQALLARLVEMGRARSLPTVAVTFSRHPLEVIDPPRAPLMLNTAQGRAEGLAASGANRVVVLDFDRSMAQIEPEEFVRDVLVRDLGMKCITVGQNFRFGRARRGDGVLLERMGREMGFDVEVASPVVVQGEVVSSTLIRGLVEAGDVRRAALMLGSCYEVRGSVVHGDGHGRELGFPTANVNAAARQLLPANGIYAVNARLGRVRIRGAVNLGVRPTLGGGPRWLEVHLIGYDGDLYGQEMEVQFLERLRDEVKFGSLPDLIAQIHQDIRDALDVPDCEPELPACPPSAAVRE